VSLGRAALVVAVAALLAAPAGAAGLRALHVDALSMRADRAHVAVGEVFHLAIHVHVRENVAALDELVVPDVGTMQLEGDERHVSSSPAGTDVTETLTLEPTAPGAFTFKGAYLDAVDARTRKPSRFSANSVRVIVDAAGPATGDLGALTRLLFGISLGGIAVIGALAAIIALVRLRRRRTPAVVAAPPLVAPPPPVVPRTPRDVVADALRAYRTAPAHDALMRLRGALLVAAGTNVGATLRDALAATRDDALTVALFAAERTAFGPANERDAASVELIGATETWLSIVPAGNAR
jgi:hypothetical protein